MVNRQKLGDFYDLDRTDRDLQVLANVTLDDADALYRRLRDVVARLARERGSEDGSKRPLHTIMRAGYEAHELITAIYDLKWLESQYIIRSEGAELSELSPGQRGLVLLLFYLLVDTSDRPLLLDQPEENLDNQTVRTSLVPAMREATSRRQVLAVTHNPNLAVVGDADQIIVATANPSFEYASGSLAELPVGQAAIDVLEGTRGAFDSREIKYDQVVGKYPAGIPGRPDARRAADRIIWRVGVALLSRRQEGAPIGARLATFSERRQGDVRCAIV